MVPNSKRRIEVWSLVELSLGLPFGVTIGGLVRNNQGILVNGNTRIEAGDSVMVFCHEQNLKKLEKYFKADTLW